MKVKYTLLTVLLLMAGSMMAIHAQTNDHYSYTVPHPVHISMYCRLVGKMLPPCWQDVASLLAKCCQQGGKTLASVV